MKTTRYEITVRGRLSDTLVDALGDLTASFSPARTVLRGEIADQAALSGVLERIDSLGLDLLDIRATATSPGGSPCHPS